MFSIFLEHLSQIPDPNASESTRTRRECCEKGVDGFPRGKHRTHALEEEKAFFLYRRVIILLGYFAVSVDVDLFKEKVYQVLEM